MAAVEVTISGVLYDKLSRSTRPVVLIGEASLTGLEIGGGPMPPGPGGPGVWPPPHVSHPIVLPGDPSWGPPVHPSHPIVLPGDPSWGDPHPEHPIILPPPNLPVDPPPEGVKPPPPDGGWGYSPEYGWGYFPMQGGKPHPSA